MNYSTYAPEHSEAFADVTPLRIETMQTLVNMGLLNKSAIDIARHENRICKSTINFAVNRADNPEYFIQRFEFNLFK